MQRGFLWAIAQNFPLEESGASKKVNAIEAVGQAWTVKTTASEPIAKVFVMPAAQQATDMAIALFVGQLPERTCHTIYIVSNDARLRLLAVCANSDGVQHLAILSCIDYENPMHRIFYSET